MAKVNPGYTPPQLETVVRKFLTPDQFMIFGSLDEINVVQLSDIPANYFFIQRRPDLDKECWALMYHDRENQRLYLFDSEGLPYDKFDATWFSQKQSLSLYVCHSWFAFSKYTGGRMEANRTGVLCVELARMIKEEGLIGQSVIPANCFTTGMSSKFNEVISFNLQFSPQTAFTQLQTLKVDYPNVVPSSTVGRIAALVSILEKQGYNNLVPSAAQLAKKPRFFKLESDSHAPHQEELDRQPKEEAAPKPSRGKDMKYWQQFVEEKAEQLQRGLSPASYASQDELGSQSKEETVSKPSGGKSMAYLQKLLAEEKTEAELERENKELAQTECPSLMTIVSENHAYFHISDQELPSTLQAIQKMSEDDQHRLHLKALNFHFFKAQSNGRAWASDVEVALKNSLGNPTA